MKKIIIPLFILLVFVAGAVFYISSGKEKPCSTCEKNANSNKPEDIKFADYFKDETDFCSILTKETISNFLGKAVIKTDTVKTNTNYNCQYYITDNQAVIINYDTLNVEKQKLGHESLDRKIVTTPKIPMEHFLVIAENGLINEIYLVLGENEYVSINRTSGKTISEDEMVSFAANLSQIVSGIVPLSTSDNNDQTSDNTIPMPQQEDVVKNFFALIDEGKPSDAVSMMTKTITDNDSQKQAWAVQFNAINSMEVVKIESSMTGDWTDTKHTYKLVLDVKMNPDSANAPIPYYGWDNGSNIRWVTIVKENDLWKIQGLATSP